MNVINTLGLEKHEKTLYDELSRYCPELKNNKPPKDRTFFFNVLNTLKHKCMDSIVYNAIVAREKKSNI